MKKISFLLLAGALLAVTACGPSKGSLQELATESLTQSVYYPKQLRVIAISEPTLPLASTTSPRRRCRGCSEP
jgi:hypothetical protein